MGAALGAAVAVGEEVVAHAGVVPPVQDRHRLRGTGDKSLGEILRNTIFREGTYLLVLVVGLRGVVPPPAPAHLLLRVGAAAGLARHLGLWPRTCADIYPRHEVALGLI